MKRAFDIFFAIILIVILLPLFLLVSLLVKSSSKGSIFFTQDRIGRDLKIFKMYKFRTMIMGADKAGPYFTKKNDVRITKIGKFLRITSIDELPQIFNVILGDMSFVGPRPNVAAQEKQYSKKDWIEIHRVLPGITGLAQINGRTNSTHEQQLADNLEYVRNHNFFLDIKIIIKTGLQLFSVFFNRTRIN